MRIVHLPYYDDNPYQGLLMDAQRELGHDVWQGGGGGSFIGVAMREWNADVMHFHWLHPYLLRETKMRSIIRSTRFILEIILLKARGCSINWTIHNLVNHDGKHAAIERFYSIVFAKLCNACFVHSHAAALKAEQRFKIAPSNLHVIPHGHYIDAYPNEITQEDARTALDLPNDARVFLFLGRIEPYKGVFDLIDAFSDIPEHCHLLLAGKVADQELVPQLEQRVADNPRIHLHARRIPDEELQVFYNAADVVVFPFKQILTSGSLVLAMSFGKAVVAPRVPSLEEIMPADGVMWFDPTIARKLLFAWGA